MFVSYATFIYMRTILFAAFSEFGIVLDTVTYWRCRFVISYRENKSRARDRDKERERERERERDKRVREISNRESREQSKYAKLCKFPSITSSYFGSLYIM